MKKIILYTFILFFICLSAGISFVFYKIPSESQIKGCIKTTMFEVDLCSENKDYVKLKNISKYLKKSIVQTEDSNFYNHEGFDEEGIQRCFEKLKETNRIVCGGSTISQQLSKNLFLSQNKNFLRKGLEALITYKIEKTLTKDEILEKYLNVIQFGKDIFGIKKAAQYYFKKSAYELDIVESAFLAMLLPNPIKYSQSFQRKNLTTFARKRIKQIITNMYMFKSISAEEYELALNKLSYFLSTKSQENNDLIIDDEDQNLLNEFESELPPIKDIDTNDNFDESSDTGPQENLGDELEKEFNR